MAKYSLDEKVDKITINLQIEKDSTFHDLAKTTIKAVKEALAKKKNIRRVLYIEFMSNKTILIFKSPDIKEYWDVFIPEYILPYVSVIHFGIHTLRNNKPKNVIPKEYDTLFDPN